MAALAYHVVMQAGGVPCCVLRYTADGQPITERIDLVERPSNLGRGQVVYWRCPCGQLARVLYFADARSRWRCRRCCPVVYQSSRDSDRRVSALLAGAATLARDEFGDLTDGIFMARLSAATLAKRVRVSDQCLFLALKTLDRLGLGLNHEGDMRPARWHGAMGRPRRKE